VNSNSGDSVSQTKVIRYKEIRATLRKKHREKVMFHSLGKSYILKIEIIGGFYVGMIKHQENPLWV
jgi:hypothetical protein